MKSVEALNWLTSEERSRSLCALVVGEVLMGEGENENGEWGMKETGEMMEQSVLDRVV